MPVQRPYNPNAKRIAELMQADFAKVGVKAEIVSYEWGEYRKRRAGRRPRWRGHPRLDRRQRRSGQLLRRRCSAAPRSAVGNRAEVVQQGLRRPDPARPTHVTDQAERTKLYEQAQVIFKEEAPVGHASPIRCVSCRCARRSPTTSIDPFGRHHFYGVDKAE